MEPSTGTRSATVRPVVVACVLGMGGLHPPKPPWAARARAAANLNCFVYNRLLVPTAPGAPPDPSRGGGVARGRAAPRLVPGRARVAEPLSRRDVEPRLPGGVSPPEPHARRRLRARVPARRRGQGRARAHRQPARELRDGDAAAGLRRDRVLGLVRERLPARAAGAAPRRDPAPREGPRAARPDRRPRRRGDVPEPGAARTVRRSHRRGRGRADRPAHDGCPPRRDERARRHRDAAAEGRLLRPRRATRTATTPTGRSPGSTAPGA